MSLGLTIGRSTHPLSHDRTLRRAPLTDPAGPKEQVGNLRVAIIPTFAGSGYRLWSGHGQPEWGKDTTVWLREIGFTNMPVNEEMRQRASIIVSGRDGGKDLNLRTFGNDGVHLVGRVLEADQSTLRLSDDVEDVVDAADQVAIGLQSQIDRYIAEHGIDAPPADVETVDWAPGVIPTQLDLEKAGINSIVWATGYHYDFSWIDADIFDNRGYPHQQRGVTSQPGLYFIGLHGMHTVASGLFSGVGADAQHIVNHLSDTLK